LLLENVLSDRSYSDVMVLLETIDWKDSQGSFFSFQEIKRSVDIESLRCLLVDAGLESSVRVELEKRLRIDLAPSVRFGVQKYTKGAGVGPHTDGEVRSARLILNLNRGWIPPHGGIWLLSDNSRLLPKPEFIAPANNSGFAFVPAENTYHALSERNSSEAYAVILEFPLR
jgi:hypothetical protein